MNIKIPHKLLPFQFQTRFGAAQIIIARGVFVAPGFTRNTAAAFARLAKPRDDVQPVQLSVLKGSYEEVLEMLLSGFELPCALVSDDRFLAAVIDALVDDGRLLVKPFSWTA